ncbi:hypothetical protein FRT60_25400 [Pseudomonas haemolytica]|uniref:Uncharacterized protein n=1 Tax=Pseudomonas haemolytica TaxID=2600065 RepID=A0A646P5M9_9PSED|nr:hypothetical protein [Pseudomonas haemolytica]
MTIRCAWKSYSPVVSPASALAPSRASPPPQLTEFPSRNSVECGSGLAREGDLPRALFLGLARVNVHKFSFSRPSMSFFNRSRVAVPAFISYHFRK